MLAFLLALAAVPTLAGRPTELSRSGEFRGKKLLIANYYTEVPTLPLERVPPILREMGFTVDIAQNPANLPPLGSYDQRELKASVSGPLGETVSAGISFLRAKRDGYVKDPVLDRRYNDKNTTAVRADLAFTPSDRLRLPNLQPQHRPLVRRKC